jgi:transposase-like protein
MGKDKLNDKQRLFLKIYQKNMGVVAKACREANIARTTFYDWRKNYCNTLWRSRIAIC